MAAAKTERITLLATPEFKEFLTSEARREGISVAELIRLRCEQRPSDEEQELASLSAQVVEATAEAEALLREAIAQTADVLADLRAARMARQGGESRDQARMAAR